MDVGFVGGGCTVWANWVLRGDPVNFWWDRGLGWDATLSIHVRNKGFRVQLHAGVRCRHHLHGTVGTPVDNTAKVKVHVGCGSHRIDGWVNLDIAPTRAADLRADAAGALPFRSGFIDFIHCEDFVEHLDVAAARRFFDEAYRILRPGGVLRVLTPISVGSRGSTSIAIMGCSLGIDRCSASTRSPRRSTPECAVGATRSYDGETLAANLSSAGLIVEEVLTRTAATRSCADWMFERLERAFTWRR